MILNLISRLIELDSDIGFGCGFVFDSEYDLDYDLESDSGFDSWIDNHLDSAQQYAFKLGLNLDGLLFSNSKLLLIMIFIPSFILISILIPGFDSE